MWTVTPITRFLGPNLRRLSFKSISYGTNRGKHCIIFPNNDLLQIPVKFDYPLCCFSSLTNNEPSFASLFRNSPLVQLGLPEGKVAIGEIVDVVGDDLYIDFGFKFNAVCRKPKVNGQSYVRGAKVKVQINDLELSDRFLGSTQDMTLLEADVTLLGLISSPVKQELTDKPQKKKIEQEAQTSKIEVLKK